MRKRRNIKFDADNAVSIRALAENKRFILNIETAVLIFLYKKGYITKRQFDLCTRKMNVRAESL